MYQTVNSLFAGCYAEYVAVSTKMMIRKPSELSWEEAAGIPEVKNSFVDHSCGQGEKGVLS